VFAQQREGVMKVALQPNTEASESRGDVLLHAVAAPDEDCC
jgi:hypothetical protein